MTVPHTMRMECSCPVRKASVVIYRDTLTRDFGKDQTLLRAKIIETVRHEVGHALGLDEAGVRKLGL